ncbi:magnesium/cobalt transporter CorA [Chrysiogenes arsenatis]|uniref:magnesium/cobalt transporter CorA n=1 Tax=Chrysiogenes arsenatis TaxID=309797 RepID=UPI00041FDE36|nr:magnesium/cobalt transporter CorA [Chrysiogenes arsenatis]
MVRSFVKIGDTIQLIEGIESLMASQSQNDQFLWIDLLSPTPEDVRIVKSLFKTFIPSQQESQEIEISSRYWEEDRRIEINSYFLITNENNPHNETVSFILQDKVLFSVRYKELNSFHELHRKLINSPNDFRDGDDVFCKVLDIRIDIDADTIEFLSKDLAKIRRLVFTDYANDDEEILQKIASYEDLNMKMRENLTDKQRILTSILKSKKFKESLKSEVLIMLKDIKSLIEHTDFNFERLDYLQNVFLGLLGIEQNKVIKIFTIVNVIFLPPTLIASIYGMNFDFMPELHWDYGYIFSIVLMVFAAIMPLVVFKRKGWI